MAATTPATTIVVVDDYPDTRSLMSFLLRAEGYVVREAATGAEALALAAEEPSLMILDEIGRAHV